MDQPGLEAQPAQPAPPPWASGAPFVPYAPPGAVSDMAGRRVLADGSTDSCFKCGDGLALAAAHLDADRIFRRAVRVDIKHEAGGASMITFGGCQLFDGRRRRRLCLFLGGVGRGWCLWGCFFGIRLISASTAEPAGLRAAGQQNYSHQGSHGSLCCQ